MTGFHKKKKKQKEKRRLLRLLVLRTDPKEETLAAFLRVDNLLTQVGPFCSPMWVHFSRRLPDVGGRIGIAAGEASVPVCRQDLLFSL